MLFGHHFANNQTLMRPTTKHYDPSGTSESVGTDTQIWSNKNYKFGCIPSEHNGKLNIIQSSHDGVYNKLEETLSHEVDWYILVRDDNGGGENGGIPQSDYISTF